MEVKNNKLFSISLMVIIILLIVVIGILIYKDNNQESKPKASINLKSEVVSVEVNNTINMSDYLSLENVTIDELEISVSDASLAKVEGSKVVANSSKGNFNIIVKYQDIEKKLFVSVDEKMENSENLFTKITFDELNKMLKENNKFVFVIASHRCSACLYYHGILNEVIADTSAEIYYVDILELTEEEYDDLCDMFPFEWTPTTVFIKNGQEDKYERIVGAASTNDLILSLKKNGIIE